MQSYYKKKNFKLAVNHLMSLPKSPILLNGIPFERVELFKHLGIVISSDLSWSNHITSIGAKAKRILGLLYRQYYKHVEGHVSSNNFISHLSDHTWNTVVYAEGQEEP